MPWWRQVGRAAFWFMATPWLYVLSGRLWVMGLWLLLGLAAACYEFRPATGQF